VTDTTPDTDGVRELCGQIIDTLCDAGRTDGLHVLYRSVMFAPCSDWLEHEPLGSWDYSAVTESPFIKHLNEIRGAEDLSEADYQRIRPSYVRLFGAVAEHPELRDAALDRIIADPMLVAILGENGWANLEYEWDSWQSACAKRAVADAGGASL